MDEPPTEEKRLEFIKDYVLKTLRLKKDQWQKCVAVEEHKQVIQDFLDKSDHTPFVVYLNTAGQLVPTNEFTWTSKNKAVYLMKHSQTAVSADTMRTDLRRGVMSCSALEQLSVFVETVSEEESFVARTLVVHAPYAGYVVYVKVALQRRFGLDPSPIPLWSL